MAPRPGNQHVLDVLPESLVLLEVDYRRCLAAFLVGDELYSGHLGNGLLESYEPASHPNEMGVPPALPGRQSNFENSGSIPPAGAFVFAEARCLASLVPLQLLLLLLFTGCDQAPLRGQQP